VSDPWESISLTQDELLTAANELERGGLTKAGRSLAKHGARPDSAFAQPRGNPQAINQSAHQIVQAILEDEDI
jgi:hypothetical protein